jgi:hypothetical protein
LAQVEVDGAWAQGYGFYLVGLVGSSGSDLALLTGGKLGKVTVVVTLPDEWGKKGKASAKPNDSSITKHTTKALHEEFHCRERKEKEKKKKQKKKQRKQ